MTGIAVGQLSGARRLWQVGRPKNVGTVVAVVVLALVVIAAVAPGVLSHGDPLDVAPRYRLRAPSLAHPFGTDQLGRDVLTRVIYGTGASLTAALVAVAIAVVGGALIGVGAGYLGGWTDRIGMRLVDVLLAVPALLLSMTVIAATGGGTIELGVAVGVAGIAGASRVIRSRTLQLRSTPFVEAALVSGWSRPTVVRRHVLPHLWPTTAAVASVEFGQAVLAVAALGFLGFGPRPPAPEWGAMVADGRAFVAGAWWLTAAPALVITVVVLAAYRLSRMIGENHRA
ncbi:putative ABC transporter permease protein [Gordonia effusa NBRC 100432]|uniref:Putative ABC transporter permease protein n=1 Tax=Gordonia effusa NBRC 100432 TaxID=1077974 RepID=H0QZ92_9ACTN|nr:ABC transporter permease [Gordonia effusa]GAB18143.1 putative ABC transporter permease protein [Gordonia effusa NBRC 100432]